jgi:hypothetical protein
MRKWFLVICPLAMLAVFLGFYLASKHKWDADAAQAAEIARKAQIQEDAKKASQDEAARVAARQRADNQKREEEAREKTRLDKWNADTRAIEAVTAQATQEADASSKEVAALELEADTLRKQKEKVNRQDFDLLKQVELSHAREQTAELEISRLVTMVNDRAVLAVTNPAANPVAR